MSQIERIKELEEEIEELEEELNNADNESVIDLVNEIKAKKAYIINIKMINNHDEKEILI